MVAGDAYESLKALRKVNPNCFNRGTIIHIERELDSYAYDTFLIGSTDPDYFIILCISYYEKLYFATYSISVGWTEKQFIVT